MDMLLKSNWMHMGYALILFFFGYFISKWIAKLVFKGVTRHFSRHQALLARRFVFHSLLLVFMISGLQHLGFNLSVLLGAAGILTVAISFASQTAASNLVSGLFLLFEAPFKVGDTITVQNVSGTVDAIDLMSTKIKTSDNQLIRIPNESMMKSEIINQSYFKTRRSDIFITIAYENDVEQVKKCIFELIKANPHIHPSPQPSVIVHDLKAIGLELKIMVWTNTRDVSQVRDELIEAIKQTFEQEKIEIPVQKMSNIYADPLRER